MSDLMLYGVLRMPYDMAMSDEMSRRQFYSRVQEAVRRMEAAEDKLEELSRATPPSPSTASEVDERAAFEAWAKANNVQLTLDVNHEGYHYPLAKCAWAAWQARAALAAKPSAQEDAQDETRDVTWRALLDAVVREFPRNMGRPSNGNAPGHCHSRPGIWDDDNGALAGKPCAWCIAWNGASKALAAEQATKEKA